MNVNINRLWLKNVKAANAAETLCKQMSNNQRERETTEKKNE